MNTSWVQAGDTVQACERLRVLDTLDQRLVLMHVLKMNRVELITQSERKLTELEALSINDMLTRRLAGEPLAYLVGSKEFFGLEFNVNPDVLIPRPDTELIVELALQFAPPHAKVLDLGTGSGAIAITLKKQRPDLQVVAVDLSQAALAVAKSNAATHQTTIDFYHSDWFTAIPPQRFDLILSNPPYIEKNDPHLNALHYEPQTALTDFADGLNAYRAILKHAPPYTHSTTQILFEHGYDQGKALRQLLALQEMKQIQTWEDLSGNERVTGGYR